MLLTETMYNSKYQVTHNNYSLTPFIRFVHHDRLRLFLLWLGRGVVPQVLLVLSLSLHTMLAVTLWVWFHGHSREEVSHSAVA